MRFYDKDPINDDDPLGEVVVDFKEAIKKRILMRDVNILAQPQWLDLELYNEPSGRVLVSFNYFK